MFAGLRQDKNPREVVKERASQSLDNIHWRLLELRELGFGLF